MHAQDARQTLGAVVAKIEEEAATAKAAEAEVAAAEAARIKAAEEAAASRAKAKAEAAKAAEAARMKAEEEAAALLAAAADDVGDWADMESGEEVRSGIHRPRVKPNDASSGGAVAASNTPRTFRRSPASSQWSCRRCRTKPSLKRTRTTTLSFALTSLAGSATLAT